MSNKPNVLFLADTTHHTAAVQDHIQAITSGDGVHWHVINPLVCKTVDKLDLSLFDAIGIHYSIKPYNHYYLSAGLKRKISEYSSVKFLFLQDEYQRVNQVQDYLYALKFNLLFTLVNQSIIAKAYPDPRLCGLKKVTILTGYVQEDMKLWSSPDIAQRPIDVSYRGRRCDYWLGSLAYEKQFIAEQFVRKAADKHLKLDISLEESDRVYGDAWLTLLKNSKAVLGTESGASIWDFDRSIEKQTNAYLRRHKNADFPEVYEQVLKPYDGKILYNAVSPRVFEAAATKTPMILFPGEYSGVCKPDIHYIKLEKDFSNMEEVCEKLKDYQFLQQLADRTYATLIESNEYSQHQFANIVMSEVLELIKTERYENSSVVDTCIKANIAKNNILNLSRRSITELRFIIVNGFQILFDGKYSLSTKLMNLFKGFKRYASYLSPRLKRKHFTQK
ncbi:hypothetical protein [Legionella spiritensis]|uniref:hypothetical protein n=1 Tax=Legionella spiritensis TaxID=452 RepID=UPI000F6BCEFA|nr:hypothetical protein [Legionella spiritensis]VEG89672.1 Uncharacterised protein [Legionella spiritensis]